jgi:hypothetical protein
MEDQGVNAVLFNIFERRCAFDKQPLIIKSITTAASVHYHYLEIFSELFGYLRKLRVKKITRQKSEAHGSKTGFTQKYLQFEANYLLKEYISCIIVIPSKTLVDDR